MVTEEGHIAWIELYLAVVKCCEEDCSAHCDAFAVERRNNLGSVTRIYNTSGTAVFSAYYDPWGRADGDDEHHRLQPRLWGQRQLMNLYMHQMP